MNKTAMIDANAAKRIISELERIEEFKAQIIRLIPDGVLPYGSRLWWEKEALAGEEDIEKGKYKTYKNSKLLIDDLHKGV